MKKVLLMRTRTKGTLVSVYLPAWVQVNDSRSTVGGLGSDALRESQEVPTMPV